MTNQKPNSTVTSRELNDPVSRHMRGGLTLLREGMTVRDALEKLRADTVAEKIVYFYVVAEDERLTGVVPTRRLLMSDPGATVASIMVRNVVTIPAEATVLDACEAFSVHRYLAFPVVDENDRPIGVVDVNLFTDELADVAERREADNAFQLIGVHLEVARKGSIFGSYTDRFPWLLSNIAGGVVCALISGYYEVLLEAVIVLALFIPVTLAVAESVSIQSATLTLQSLAHGLPRRGEFIRSLLREFLVASLLGLSCGFLVAGTLWLWKGEALVGLTIWLAITLAMITACLLGIILPTAVRALGKDPKIAAGPVVLACTDIGTLLFYFNLSALLLK